MTNTTRILKAAPRSRVANRVSLADLSEPTPSRCVSDGFTPLSLPVARQSRDESQTDPRLSSTLAALQSAADQLHAQRDRWLEQSQNEAVRLGIAIAERLFRRTLVLQPETVLDLVRSALDWTAPSERLRIRLHPEDRELIEAAKGSLLADRNIEFLADDTLSRGDCVLETPNGQTDARLDVVLQRIAEELVVE